MPATFTSFRTRALWAGAGLVLILPALAGGYSTLAGWPQAVLLFALFFALQLFDPAQRQRLPLWFHILWIGLAVLGIIWMLPGESLLFLSPNRRAWPGPGGAVSGIAADRTATLESLYLALGFCSVLGLGLILSNRAATRRTLVRWMLGMIALVLASALTIHFLHLPFSLLPDVAVLFWDRLSYPFSGANLAAAFFVGSLPFAIASATLFSDEERYLPRRRAWQLIGLVLTLSLLTMQLMTRNRAMWLALVPLLVLYAVYFFTRRKRASVRGASLAAAFGLLVVIGLFLSLFDPGKLLQRFVLLAGEDTSAVSRLLIWENAWNTFREYPGVGVGLGGFGEVCPTTAPAGIAKWPRYAHNEYLQFLAEAGLAGLVLAIAVAIPLLRDAARLYRLHRDRWHDRLPFLATLLLLLIACGVDFPLRCPALLFLFAFTWGVLFGRDTETEPATAPDSTPDSAPALPAPVATFTASPASTPLHRWAGLVLAFSLIGLSLAFTPLILQLTQRGFAVAHYQAQFRHWTQDHDDAALASAAQRLLDAAHGQPRASTDALGVLIGTADTAEQLAKWEVPIQAVLAQSPYHDSLYYFQARLAFLRHDFDSAARLNTFARRCAATNVRTLRQIAILDFALAASTADPALRRARITHAQATTRWLLSKDPSSARDMAEALREFGLPLSDLLPCYPVGWTRIPDFCIAAQTADRPLTAQQFLREFDFAGQTAEQAARQDEPPPLPSRNEITLLLSTGQSDPANTLIQQRFIGLPLDQRSLSLAEARQFGWGILSAAQWDQIIAAVQANFPTAADRYHLGWIYLYRSQWALAEIEWRKAYKTDRSPRSCEALVRLYSATRAWPLAAEYALEWTQLAPKDPDAWRTYARIECWNRNYPAARVAFDHYRALDPTRAAADFQLSGEINMALSPANRPAPPPKP